MGVSWTCRSGQSVWLMRVYDPFRSSRVALYLNQNITSETPVLKGGMKMGVPSSGGGDCHTASLLCFAGIAIPFHDPIRHSCEDTKLVFCKKLRVANRVLSF